MSARSFFRLPAPCPDRKPPAPAARAEILARAACCRTPWLKLNLLAHTARLQVSAPKEITVSPVPYFAELSAQCKAPQDTYPQLLSLADSYPAGHPLRRAALRKFDRTSREAQGLIARMTELLRVARQGVRS